MDVTMDEDKWFREVAQAEKRIEAKKFNPKFAPGPVSSAPSCFNVQSNWS
jgi:hypothetical protein